MKRRQLLATATGAAGVAAAGVAASRAGLIPPDHRGPWAPGAALTFAAQRLLAPGALAREYPPEKISRKPFANGRPLQLPAYQASLAQGFADWRLTIGGEVSRPGAYSLADLRAMPVSHQTTSLTCEEGWNFIAQWTGVRLAHLLEEAGIAPGARYVVYESMESDWWDSLDMNDALHPQTFAVYGLNGADLPPGHGGPLRMRVPRQLGYKSVKYLTGLTVTSNLAKLKREDGSASVGAGYAWYSGI